MCSISYANGEILNVIIRPMVDIVGLIITHENTVPSHNNVEGVTTILHGVEQG